MNGRTLGPGAMRYGSVAGAAAGRVSRVAASASIVATGSIASAARQLSMSSPCAGSRQARDSNGACGRAASRGTGVVPANGCTADYGEAPFGLRSYRATGGSGRRGYDMAVPFAGEGRINPTGALARAVWCSSGRPGVRCPYGRPCATTAHRARASSITSRCTQRQHP